MKPRYKAWYGGECPVDKDSEVETILRDGYVSRLDAAEYDWNHYNSGRYVFDIIAYRVIEENENERIL